MATTKVTSGLRTFTPSEGQVAVLSKAGAYTIVSGDYGATINVTAAATMTLPDAATVGSGWWCRVRRPALAGGTNVTVSRAGTDTIAFGSDGTETSLLLAGDGDYVDVVSDGANWVATGNITVALNVYSGWPNPVTQSVPSATITTLEFNSINRDTHSGFNVSTFEYTVPLSGAYNIRGVVGVETQASDFVTWLYMQSNGSAVENAEKHIAVDTAFLAEDHIDMTATTVYDKGDVLTVAVQHNRTGSINFTPSADNPNMNYWTIYRVGNRW